MKTRKEEIKDENPSMIDWNAPDDQFEKSLQKMEERLYQKEQKNKRLAEEQSNKQKHK